jgi:hypothetical protein
MDETPAWAKSLAVDTRRTCDQLYKGLELHLQTRGAIDSVSDQAHLDQGVQERH